jgi:hypothetical protein
VSIIGRSGHIGAEGRNGVKGSVMRKPVKTKGRELTEFTDVEGKKWVQTSTEDLFSVKELNEIINSMEKKDDEGEEIILARIDFKKVNRDYHEKLIELQHRIKKKNEIIKRLVEESKGIIQKKNLMLRELIEYVKKLHLLIAYYNINPKNVEKVDIPPDLYQSLFRKPGAAVEAAEEERIEYSDVQEVLLDDEGNEIKPE